MESPYAPWYRFMRQTFPLFGVIDDAAAATVRTFMFPPIFGFTPPSDTLPKEPAE